MKKKIFILSLIMILGFTLCLLVFKDSKFYSVTANVLVVQKSDAQLTPWIVIRDQMGEERKIIIKNTEWDSIVIGEKYTISYTYKDHEMAKLKAIYLDGYTGSIKE